MTWRAWRPWILDLPCRGGAAPISQSHGSSSRASFPARLVRYLCGFSRHQCTWSGDEGLSSPLQPSFSSSPRPEAHPQLVTGSTQTSVPVCSSVSSGPPISSRNPQSSLAMMDAFSVRAAGEPLGRFLCVPAVISLSWRVMEPSVLLARTCLHGCRNRGDALKERMVFAACRGSSFLLAFPGVFQQERTDSWPAFTQELAIGKQRHRRSTRRVRRGRLGCRVQVTRSVSGKHPWEQWLFLAPSSRTFPLPCPCRALRYLAQMVRRGGGIGVEIAVTKPEEIFHWRNGSAR